MTLHKITAPVPGYTGTVAGVTLANGVGETDNEGALSYFRRHGYTVEPVEETPVVEQEDDGQGDGEQPPARPAKSASKTDWIAYAIGQGMSEEDADAATRDALVERYADGGDA
ncbi:hypothetical protein [Nocardiopsis tropica]|uniref:Lsr2 protein n=1 Tax=Nocardiopsis tropica TaxID=109330 RepID=A0ABU7KLZ1_9ACTN|nr:hypothetical protein [Nocardiopsis umidischolae]MEE2050311.1 hypothetical protein [Nocardiopsis umidischolae]